MPRANLPIRPRAKKPRLRIADILKWADEFHDQNGRWPTFNDGIVAGAGDQTWRAADASLRVGTRGLPGGSSLAKLLLKHRGRRHWHLPPDLTVAKVLALADAHHRRTGDWPGRHDGGPVPNGPKGLTWVAVELALQRGKWGLPGGQTLAQFLEQHRGVRNRLNVADLTESGILAWADAHHACNGEWPSGQNDSWGRHGAPSNEVRDGHSAGTVLGLGVRHGAPISRVSGVSICPDGGGRGGPFPLALRAALTGSRGRSGTDIDERDRKAAEHRRRQLPARTVVIPEAVVVEVDGGRIRTRAAGSPGFESGSPNAGWLRPRYWSG